MESKNQGHHPFIVIFMNFSVFVLAIASGEMVEAIVENYVGEVYKNLGFISLVMIYIGTVAILHFSFPPQKERTVGLSKFTVAIVMIEFLTSANLLFLEMVPKIQWGRTIDILTFVAALIFLSSLILIVVLYTNFLNDLEEIEKDGEDGEKNNNN